MLSSRIHVHRDPQKAVELYQKAADQGYDVALNNLAQCYETGIGVAADRQRAIELYRAAAAKNNMQALGHLARLGVPVLAPQP